MSDQPVDTVPEDDDYVSSEDEDFAPVDEGGSSESGSGDEDEATVKTPSKGKKSAANKNSNAEIVALEKDEVEGLMQDAGKQKKRKRKGGDADEYDSGGEGGFVKTRSMAAAHKEEKKKPLASNTEATIDIDSLWKNMNSASLQPSRAAPPPLETCPSKPFAAISQAAPVDPSVDLVTLTETYEFAGETHTRTIQVPRDSAQAQAQAQTQTQTQAQPATPSTPAPQQKLGPDGQLLVRPLRRISAFDPNPTGLVKGLPDPNAPLKVGDSKNKNKGAKHKYVIPRVKQPTKLNVVDKSKLDWESHVKAIGDRDELEAAKKRKDNFLEKRDFLDRVGGREDEVRSAIRTK